MPKTYIAIPVYNHFDMTMSRLYELMRHCSTDIECVYVINDASSDETHEGLKWWVKPTVGLQVNEIPITKNRGFLLAANYGLRSISKSANPEDLLVLLSSDVQITGNFLQDILPNLSSTRLLGARFLYADTGWNKFGDRLFPYLEGWMLATTVKGWETLGYFDERFAPNDYEDVDLSTTASNLGFELMEVGHGKLFHKGGGTLGYTPERLEQTNKNKAKFQEKWVK